MSTAAGARSLIIIIHMQIVISYSDLKHTQVILCQCSKHIASTGRAGGGTLEGVHYQPMVDRTVLDKAAVTTVSNPLRMHRSVVDSNLCFVTRLHFLLQSTHVICSRNWLLSFPFLRS